MAISFTLHEKAERLQEIREEMLELVREARELVRGTSEESRANAYWLAHLRCAIDHDYLSRSITMADTIEALESADEENDSD